MADPMRILVVADRFPWPPTGGGQLRLAATIEALADGAALDFFFLSDKSAPEPVVPTAVTVSRVGCVPYPQMARSWRWRAGWLARGGTPMEVAVRRYDPLPAQVFASWTADHYDLVWFNTLTTFAWLGRPRLGPTVVDLDNLESEKERQRGRLQRRSDPTTGVVGRFRQSAIRIQTAVNAGDWKGLERSAARSVARVVLCSEVDVGRSGLDNAVVIPNTYRRPSRPLGRPQVTGEPTILFQGTLEYGPNVDAARWLARDLAPRIRARVPDTRIRLVGNTIAEVERLHHPPQVTVVGRVPAMEQELARADLAVVPLRSGSGTRLKILESFAHRLPVVSTTLGAEGLDVEDGVHLLVADDADGFAAACERLLTDGDLRVRIADAAEQHFLDRFAWPVVAERIRTLALDASGTGTRRQVED